MIPMNSFRFFSPSQPSIHHPFDSEIDEFAQGSSLFSLFEILDFHSMNSCKGYAGSIVSDNWLVY